MARVGSLLCPVIVGRDDLLADLDRRLEEAAAGRGSALFLAGQAGLGKTRLVRAALRRATALGVRFDGGAVAPQDVEVPLASILEMARGLTASEFGTLGPDILSMTAPGVGDALGARRALVRGIADRILAAVDRPTLLVFDDLHWADEMSLEVIGELARHIEGRPLFLLGGYRADEFPVGTIHREWRARLVGQRLVDEVALRPLTLEETGIATTLILGTELPAPRDVVAAVYERTNGIPLHVEELLGALDDDARSDGRRIRDAHVPTTIEGAVRARLERLSDEARSLARAGAVVGRCFSPDVIAGIMDRPLGELDPAFEELVDAAILHPFDYIDQGYFDFRHQLLRDAIYATVPPAQLRRLHAQAAEFGMSLIGASVMHASRHYERAGLRPQAFRTARAGADEASRISARREAYELYRRAIDNMPPDLPLAEQARLYRDYSDAAAAIERNADGRVAAETARRLFLEADLAVEAAGILLALAGLDARDGAHAAATLDLTNQALAELEREPASPARAAMIAEVYDYRAWVRLELSDFAGSRADTDLVAAMADALGDHETALDVRLTRSLLNLRAEGPLGLADGLAAAREAREAGFESVAVTGYRNLAISATWILDYDAADAAIREGLAYADAIEQSHCRQMMATTSALIAWSDGRWDEADALARQELVERGCQRGIVGALDVIGLVALGRGRLDEARRRLRQSLEIGRGTGIPTQLTPLWGLLETALAGGRTAEAVELVEEARGIAIGTGERALAVPFIVSGTRAFLEARRPDEAERWRAWAESFFAGWEPTAGPALAHATGLVRLAAGSPGAAREALEAAIDGWERHRRTWEATFARLDLAHCLLRAGRFAEASARLAVVGEIVTALGSPVLAARAEELVRAARGRGVSDEPWRPLTAREFEVARLIAEGLTNAEIADRLTIAPKTASAHVEHILAKLGVTRRAEIAAWTATVARATPPSEPDRRPDPRPAVTVSSAR